MEDQLGEPLAMPQGRRRSGLVAGVAVVGILVVLAAIGRSVGDGDDPSAPGTPGATVAAGCSPVEQFQPPESPTHEVGDIAYESAPAYGGPHHPSPLSPVQRVVTRDGAPDHVVERAVHNLEHGYVVVWYSDAASDEQIEAVGDAVRDADLRKVLVVPWQRGALDTPFVLAAWGALRECAAPDTATIRAFWDAHGGPNGSAPEKDAP